MDRLIHPASAVKCVEFYDFADFSQKRQKFSSHFRARELNLVVTYQVFKRHMWTMVVYHEQVVNELRC